MNTFFRLGFNVLFGFLKNNSFHSWTTFDFFYTLIRLKLIVSFLHQFQFFSFKNSFFIINYLLFFPFITQFSFFSIFCSSLTFDLNNGSSLFYYSSQYCLYFFLLFFRFDHRILYNLLNLLWWLHPCSCTEWFFFEWCDRSAILI